MTILCSDSKQHLKKKKECRAISILSEGLESTEGTGASMPVPRIETGTRMILTKPDRLTGTRHTPAVSRCPSRIQMCVQSIVQLFIQNQTRSLRHPASHQSRLKYSCRQCQFCAIIVILLDFGCIYIIIRAKVLLKHPFHHPTPISCCNHRY
jgi:hypothetical protein